MELPFLEDELLWSLLGFVAGLAITFIVAHYLKRRCGKGLPFPLSGKMRTSAIEPRMRIQYGLWIAFFCKIIREQPD